MSTIEPINTNTEVQVAHNEDSEAEFLQIFNSLFGPEAKIEPSMSIQDFVASRQEALEALHDGIEECENAPEDAKELVCDCAARAMEQLTDLIEEKIDSKKEEHLSFQEVSEALMAGIAWAEIAAGTEIKEKSFAALRFAITQIADFSESYEDFLSDDELEELEDMIDQFVEAHYDVWEELLDELVSDLSDSESSDEASSSSDEADSSSDYELDSLFKEFSAGDSSSDYDFSSLFEENSDDWKSSTSSTEEVKASVDEKPAE